MKIARKWLHEVVEALLESGGRSALKAISEKEVIQATRVMYDGKPSPRGIDIRLTVGRPNYLARRFVKACLKAGETFPVKKIQLRFPARRKK